MGLFPPFSASSFSFDHFLSLRLRDLSPCQAPTSRVSLFHPFSLMSRDHEIAVFRRRKCEDETPVSVSREWESQAKSDGSVTWGRELHWLSMYQMAAGRRKNGQRRITDRGVPFAELQSFCVAAFFDLKAMWERLRKRGGGGVGWGGLWGVSKTTREIVSQTSSNKGGWARGRGGGSEDT